MKKAYGLAELPKPQEMERIAAAWHPYCSIASWYLWRSLENPRRDVTLWYNTLLRVLFMSNTITQAAAPAIVVGEEQIDEALRLRLYRLQVEIREAEQRAYDLFLQSLVKGTSHLSLGQEAVAAGCAAAMQKGDLSFCTYRGHAHTIARGVPIEKVLGELMGRDNGLLRGKGGSMHLTSVEHGVMGSYAIIGAHLPIACGAAWRAQYKGAKRRFGLLLRRRHHQHWRVPRGV